MESSERGELQTSLSKKKTYQKDPLPQVAPRDNTYLHYVPDCSDSLIDPLLGMRTNNIFSVLMPLLIKFLISTLYQFLNVYKIFYIGFSIKYPIL